MNNIRRKHSLNDNEDVVVCCKHSNDFYIETNGCLIDIICNFLCDNRLNYLSRVYMFTCVSCLKNLQSEVVTLYDLNNNWRKHYVDCRDIEQIYLNKQFRFLALSEVNSSYFFSNNPYLTDERQ